MNITHNINQVYFLIGPILTSIYKPLYKPLFGYTNHDSYRIEVKVCRDTLDKAKEFLRNLYPKISYDYNWN